jgi:hypothetical protein
VMILVTEFLSLHLILLSYSYLVHFIYSMNTKALEYMDFTVHLCTLQSGVYRFSTRVFSPILYSSVALIFIYCKHKSTVGKLITSQTPQCTKSLIDQTEKCFKWKLYILKKFIFYILYKSFVPQKVLRKRIKMPHTVFHLNPLTNFGDTTSPLCIHFMDFVQRQTL